VLHHLFFTFSSVSFKQHEILRCGIDQVRSQDFQRGLGDEHVNLVVVGDRELRSVLHLVETREHEEIRLRVEREKEKTKFRKEASDLRKKRACVERHNIA
jgi:hypothetical protein